MLYLQKINLLERLSQKTSLEGALLFERNNLNNLILISINGLKKKLCFKNLST
jgi:hypothetical protein